MSLIVAVALLGVPRVDPPVGEDRLIEKVSVDSTAVSSIVVTLTVWLREPDAPYSLMSWSAERRHASGLIRVSASWLLEPQTVLGGWLNSMFGQGESHTLFADLEAEQRLGGAWSVAGAYRRGWTSLPGGPLATSALSFDLSRVGLLNRSDVLALRISQPLRVERGSIGLRVPVSWDYLTNTATEGQQILSLTPSGREVFAEASYMQNLTNGSLSLHAYARRDPDHVPSRDADVGGALRASLKL